MGQQIGMESAFASYRDRAVDLFHENVLLKAHVAELQGELARLQGTAPAAGEQEPVPASSYLGDAYSGEAAAGDRVG